MILNVCGRDVVQALLVSLVFVMLDKGLDLVSETGGQTIVLQQNPVLHGQMPMLGLALDFELKRCAANSIRSSRLSSGMRGVSYRVSYFLAPLSLGPMAFQWLTSAPFLSRWFFMGEIGQRGVCQFDNFLIEHVAV